MTAWKPKERELTLEEAIELAKKELAPYWWRSTPLFAVVTQAEANNAAKLHPLDPSFFESQWLIMILDPTHPHCPTDLNWLKTLAERYESFNLKTILIISPRYGLFMDRSGVGSWSDKHHLKFTLVTDKDHLLQKALNLTSLPGWVYFGLKGKMLNSGVGAGSLESLDAFIQKTLRETDPGLPFPPPLIPKTTVNFKEVDFSELQIGKELYGSPQAWIKKEGWRAQENDAELRLNLNGISTLYLLGTPNYGTASIQINDAPVMERYWGEDYNLQFNKLGSLELIKNYPKEKPFNIKITFHQAKLHPFELLGLYYF